MKIKMIVAVSIATAATALPLAAIAHADSNSSFEFQSPSGNIGCKMFNYGNGVVCTIRDHTWAAPPPAGGDCQYADSELKLFLGDPPCVGVWPNQIFLYPPPTLDYGQTHTVGTMTCDSERSGVTCTDSSTGHFFRVSRESYQLG